MRRRGGSTLTVWSPEAAQLAGSLTGIAHRHVWAGGDPLTFGVSPRGAAAAWGCLCRLRRAPAAPLSSNYIDIFLLQ
jgi:hypothetical protein